MIIYNITCKVHPAIEDDWLRWQKEEHIPEMMRSGLFTAHRIFRLLEQDDSEGNTYVLQFSASALEDYERYRDEFAPSLGKKAFDKWGDLFIAFKTIMQVV